MSRHVRYTVALASAGSALLVGGCAQSGSTAPSPSQSPSPAAAAEVSPREQYLDRVNKLCDELLPKVLKATHGGSTDIPAQQYLRDWPEHQRALVAFDRSLAAVPIPAPATHLSEVMASYVQFADRLDAARLKAAHQGESAWRHEVASESDIESDPAITARNAAGFAPSCDAR